MKNFEETEIDLSKFTYEELKDILPKEIIEAIKNPGPTSAHTITKVQKNKDGTLDVTVTRDEDDQR